jgi:hypothetical protein
MQYYQELNLPQNPLAADSVEQLHILKASAEPGYQYHTLIVDDAVINSLLSKELMDIFQSLGAVPRSLIYFGLLGRQQHKTFFHSDLSSDGTQWLPHPFALNWELTPGETINEWWDAGDAPVFVPPEIRPANYVGGAHIYSRGNRESHDAKLLATYQSSSQSAFLIKTNIPHRVRSNTTAESRMCISVRFDRDLAWDTFAPYFTK